VRALAVPRGPHCAAKASATRRNKNKDVLTHQYTDLPIGTRPASARSGILWNVADPRNEPQDSTVAPVSEDQQAQAYATLASAFFEDPVERWMYSAPHQYRTHFPEFVAAFGGNAFQHETVWTLGGFSAVAMWMPPGIEPDGDAITTVLTDTVDPSKHDDLFAVLEQMEAAHPRDAHWYLPWFGVTAELQGRGLGGTLIAHCLSVVDASHLPAYLETPSPRNITFYERHGFSVTGEAQAGECPPITFMSRAAR